MSSVDDYYPSSCAFCKISAAYPASTAHHASSAIPTSPDPDLLSPPCYLLLSAPRVLAFLDIMPIASGHILLTTRQHYEKLSNIQGSTAAEAEEARAAARALGEWLPVVSRALSAATGVEDWNVVQNNGARAAQVVPHVHFHLIPRYQEGRLEQRRGRNGKVDVGMLKSWRVFGRGSREDLDEEEAKELAGRLRDAMREELEAGEKKKTGKL